MNRAGSKGRIEDVLTDRELGLSPGVLRTGRIDWQPISSNSVTWGQDGGLVRCESGELAKSVVQALEEADLDDPDLFAKLTSTIRDKLGEMPCDMFHLFYSSEPSSTHQACHDVVSIQAEELPVTPRENESYVGIRKENSIVSYACAFPQYEVEGHKFYWIGVQTDPAYRRQGMAEACIYAMQRQMGNKSVAIWQCRAANTASVALAKSAGYTHLATTFVWSPPQII